MSKRKNKNKKLAAVIITLAVLIPAVSIIFVVFGLHPGKLRADGINSIDITAPDGSVFSYTDIETFELYADIFDKATIIDDPANDILSYKIFLLHIDRKTDDIDCEMLLSDSHEDCLLKSESENGTVFKTILPEYASKILMDENFSTAYTYHFPPEATISVTEQPEALSPVELEWSYRKCDGNYYQFDAEEHISDTLPTFDYTPGKTIELGFELTPDSVSVQIFDGDTPIFGGNYSSDEYKDFTYNKKTALRYVFTAEWYEISGASYHGKAVYEINVNYIVDPVGLLSASSIKQGDFTVFSVYNTADDEALTVKDESFPFVRHGDVKMMLYPAYIGGFVGQKTLEAADSTGFKMSAFIDVSLSDALTEYEIHSSLPSDLYVVNYQTPTDAVSAIRQTTIAISEKAWNGEFSQPLDNPQTLISYNTPIVKTVQSEEAEETEEAVEKEQLGNSSFMLMTSASPDVKAVASGKVAFAGMLEPYGNTVIINHGMGIHSFYSNLDSLFCAQGDDVTKGLTIAKLNTVSGAALQYGILINGYFVNPASFNACLSTAGLL